MDRVDHVNRLRGLNTGHPAGAIDPAKPLHCPLKGRDTVAGVLQRVLALVVRAHA